MYLRLIVLTLCALQVSSFPHHEEDEARVLSEVWEAMDKHRGDDIIVIPRHDGPSDRGPSDHHGRSSEGHGPSGPSGHDRSPSSDGEKSSEKTTEEKSEGSVDVPAESSSSSSPSEHSEGEGDHHGRSSRSHESEGEGSFDKMWGKLNKMGDMMNRAVERLRKDDAEIKELENGSSSNGLTVMILEIVGAVVVGLIVVGLLIFGLAKGVRKIKTWKARRESERLVDQEAPNMDGTGYQSGYNP